MAISSLHRVSGSRWPTGSMTASAKSPLSRFGSPDSIGRFPPARRWPAMRAGDAPVIATPKHFLGDGGTGGVDEGDHPATEGELRSLDAAPAPPSPRRCCGVAGRKGALR